MTYAFLMRCRFVPVLFATSLSVLPALAAPGDPAAFEGRKTAAAPAVFRYHLALDQLAQGDFASARVLAESARASYGDTPEINMLLAYLLQREGRTAEAQAALGPVRAVSPLAEAQAAQLADLKTPLPAIGPARAVASEAVPEQTAKAPAASKSGAPVTALPQPDARLKTLEAYLAGKINEERRKAGLTPLTTDSRLADTSRAHSAEMRDRGYFAHESPTAAIREPLDRYRAVFGATPALVAENIYRSWGSPRRITQKEIDAGHEALMKSPGHRANILLRDARRLGIGIVANSTGDFWITEMFAKD